MPKDKKNTSKNNIDNKSKKNVRIDAEIVSLIKGIKQAEKKESDLNAEKIKKSELERDVEIDLEGMEFNQFMQTSSGLSEGKAPVLERIAGSQQGPIFFGGVRQGRETDSKEDSSGDFKYVPSKEEKTEQQYIETSTHIYHEPEKVDLNRVGRGRDTISSANQGVFFTQSSEARAESQSSEKLWRVDRFDVERAGRKDPFERNDTKYEKYKPRDLK